MGSKTQTFATCIGRKRTCRSTAHTAGAIAMVLRRGLAIGYNAIMQEEVTSKVMLQEACATGGAHQDVRCNTRYVNRFSNSPLLACAVAAVFPLQQSLSSCAYCFQ